MRRKRNRSRGGLLFEFVRKRLARYRLSPREKEVVFLLLRGYSNKEIARQCNLSVETVKEYLKSIYNKVGTHRRTALLAHLLGTDDS